MSDLRTAAQERLDEWERKLAFALGHTHISEERHRLERALSSLRTARDELARMGREQLSRLVDRLSRDPNDWLAHRA